MGLFVETVPVTFEKVVSCAPGLPIIKRFWEKPTYPSPQPTLTLTFHSGQNVGLGEG